MTISLIQEAFGERPQLLQAVQSVSGSSPQAKAVFEEVAKYVKELQNTAQQSSTPAASQGEPSAKKRKLNGAESGANGSAVPPDFLTTTWQAPTVDVSFTVPQRKKYALQISMERSQGLRALNPASKNAEFGIPWTSVEHVLRLPVPEKTTAAHNYCVFPKGGDGFSGDGGAGAGGLETMVWSTSDVRKKGEENNPTESELVKQVLAGAGTQVIEPSEEEFVSVYKNPVRKTEKQYHVKAFRGSKEGYLFFLATGIAFVFKKPLLFFAFSAIQSISYTSVLQHTFNLNISAIPSSSKDGEPTEIEFSMLDQGDFAAIDSYVKRHELNNASMAEARKAKKYNVNKDQPKEGEGDAAAEGDSELKKAEMEVEGMADNDEDDEDDDENFDPGSEGESEGEGSSSDEEDGGQDEGGDHEMDEDDEPEEE